MIRRPPRSTLFPTRRSSDLLPEAAPFLEGKVKALKKTHSLWLDKLFTGPYDADFAAWMHRVGVRSEEHTSELQSRPHLVCRLLLEKKKKTQQTNMQQSSS